MGTEFAFKDKTVRYVSLDRLIEFASVATAEKQPPTFGDDLGPANIGYWPWPGSQVLVIDDIGPVLAAHRDQNPEPILLRKARKLRPLPRPLSYGLGSGRRRNGQARQCADDRFARAIEEFCEGTSATALHFPARFDSSTGRAPMPRRGKSRPHGELSTCRKTGAPIGAGSPRPRADTA